MARQKPGISAKEQRHASQLTTGRNQPEAATLRFRTQDDALNFAKHCAEDGHNRLAGNHLNFAERYKKFECVVVLKIAAGPNLAQYDLIVEAVPAKRVRMGNLRGASNIATPARYAVHLHSDVDQGLVLGRVTSLVQGPDGIIPSLIRFERTKERQDIGWNILAASPTNNVRFQFFGAIGNRKIGSLGIRNAAKRRADKTNLIEGRSESFNDLGNQGREFGRDRLNEFDLVNFAKSIRIQLFNASVRVSFKEFGDPPIKITDVLLCAADPLLWTSEMIDLFQENSPVLVAV